MDQTTWALLAIAIFNAITAWLTYKTRVDMKTLEVNTNSIKDALVHTTAIASRALGNVEGRAEAKAESEKQP